MIAIRAKGLRKEYQLREHAARSLKDTVLASLLGTNKPRRFAALDGIDFEFEAGLTHAIIGANGCGKSTLLKLITGIIDPTSGTIEVHGRVAALLELGSGFQPEFTGMENIFLQGAILGFSKDQVLERLPAILHFSQLEAFIHTPVKHYSSGMLARLGFSIAVNTDPEILIVDEVLAVGDEVFQQRCLERIREMRAGGCTIIFVSHALDLVTAIADRILWLDHGRICAHGTAADVMREHTQMTGASARIEGSGPRAEDVDLRATSTLFSTRLQARGVRIDAVEFRDAEGRPVGEFALGAAHFVGVQLTVLEALPGVQFHLGWNDRDFHPMLKTCLNTDLGAVQPGSYVLSIKVEDHHLPPGPYIVTVAFTKTNDPDEIYDLHLRYYEIAVEGEPPTKADGLFAGFGSVTTA
jgi:ABC-type polysaccharide/polyol phosphate transport system ATPase subunit